MDIYKKYISIGKGTWGVGDSAAEADKKRISVGHGYKNDEKVILEFESELPFAPLDRDANDNEADCWVDNYGCVYWVRCEKAEVENTLQDN